MWSEYTTERNSILYCRVEFYSVETKQPFLTTCGMSPSSGSNLLLNVKDLLAEKKKQKNVPQLLIINIYLSVFCWSSALYQCCWIAKKEKKRLNPVFTSPDVFFSLSLLIIFLCVCCIVARVFGTISAAQSWRALWVVRAFDLSRLRNHFKKCRWHHEGFANVPAYFLHSLSAWCHVFKAWEPWSSALDTGLTIITSKGCLRELVLISYLVI